MRQEQSAEQAQGTGPAAPLAGQRLLAHVRAFSQQIGPRPAGHPAEAAARRALERHLRAQGVGPIEQIAFSTADTWGYGTIVPLLAALLGGALPLGRALRAALALAAARQFWLTLTGRMRAQPLYRCYPQRPGGTLLARIAPRQPATRRVVLVGHTDTNKHRITFAPQLKRGLRLSSSALLLALVLLALADALRLTWLRRLALGYMGFAAATMLADEAGPYVEGANDNGSALACVVGLGEQALAQPLERTEVWLALTGSEEVSHDGMHALLDRYGAELRDASFIDFEMVGRGSIHYVERHAGLIYGIAYRPDPESAQIARATAAARPDLGVTGREVVIFEEVATLRRRGFRGICLVGLDADGFPANWHQRSDTTDNIDPEALARAAQFAWAMVQQIDGQAPYSDPQ